MTGKLLVFCPQIGARSETFIKRHIEHLCPQRTVVIAYEVLPSGEKGWGVNCPLYLIKRRNDIFSRGIRLIRQRMGDDDAERADIHGVKRFLKEQNVKIILGQYLNFSWPLIKLSKELDIHLFAHAHGYDLSKCFRYSYWKRRYADYKDATGVIVVNKVMQERLVSIGVPQEKIKIIPCGVDVPDFLPERRAAGTIRCLAVGRMVGKKAPLKLLASFKGALDEFPSLHLDYVGAGPLFKKAQRYVQENGLQEKVTLHGGQPHEVVSELMQKADIFLQHSVVDPKNGDEEGLPVAILEAMAVGLPVVSTRHAGIPEAVLEGETGLLVDEGDIQRMADHIVTLASNAPERSSLGEKGREVVRQRFSWQVERDSLLEFMGIEAPDEIS